MTAQKTSRSKKELKPITSFGWAGENREIQVFQKKGIWMTRSLIDSQPDPSLLKIYGTNELPTPWTKETDKETVIKELSVRNQHAMVA